VKENLKKCEVHASFIKYLCFSSQRESITITSQAFLCMGVKMLDYLLRYHVHAYSASKSSLIIS